MPSAPLFTDDLLDPFPAGEPAGTDLRWTAEWDRIKEARRADDDLQSGKWAKREHKTADWHAVRELTTAMLRERSKDLQLAMWLTEANIKLHGFAGLRDGLRITRELITRFWDLGLYPAIEDGPEDRVGPLEWLNEKLVDSITAIPITTREDDRSDYSFTDLQEARRFGSEESNTRGEDGDVDKKRKRDYDEAIARGRVSTNLFEEAVRNSPRARYEDLAADFYQAYAEFKALEVAVAEKFGDVAPNLARCRTMLEQIKQEVSDVLAGRREAEPDPPPVRQEAETNVPGQSAPNPSVIMRFPLTLSSAQGSAAANSWADAEQLLRSGAVEQGLAEMTRLAALETTGRSRFHRKLLLAEVCLTSKRNRLARSILEELAEQIDKCQLEMWESSELISGVWTRLYRIYKQSGDSSDADRAVKLYERLARLDPWQALGCSEG